MENGGQAFPLPVNTSLEYGGMTLRDYFAGQALIGMTTGQTTNEKFANWIKEQPVTPNEWLGITAYTIADAMIAERNKKEVKNHHDESGDY